MHSWEMLIERNTQNMHGKKQKGLAIIQETLNEDTANNNYIIYFTRSEKYKELENKLFKNAEIIYKNNGGGILKYNH